MKHPHATGELSARLHGAEALMRGRARTARLAAGRLDPDSPGAAALRGKAHAYMEAADLLRRLDDGANLPSRVKALARIAQWYEPAT